MGWKEEHLHQFLIHGVHYGISYPGTGGFIGNAHEIKLSKFGLREREKFSYEYDFFSSWKHQIRVEAILLGENNRGLPVCTAGKGSCPPENCGGVVGFITLRQQHSRFKLAARFAEILPLEGKLNAASVRNNLHEVAQKVESELGEEEYMFANGCEIEWSKLPRPDLPITVGIDGGYIHSCSPENKTKEWFEVIVGKSITDAGDTKCFGGVTSYDQKPKRRLFEVLKSQGMQMNQQVTFLSDGGENIRELQLYLNPQAEHLLDWFHITMRITVMKQMAKDPDIKPKWREKLLKRLESIKWYIWHGNVFEALQEIESLEDLCYGDYEEIDEETEFDLDLEISPLKLLEKVEEFQSYIEKNANSIPNYGERYRCGERIASSFVESTVNQVVSKRFVKKQQMRWSKKGAHLLLQVRNLVINQELRQRIDSWYDSSKPETIAS
jgi:hypothetical protein